MEWRHFVTYLSNDPRITELSEEGLHRSSDYVPTNRTIRERFCTGLTAD